MDITRIGNAAPYAPPTRPTAAAGSDSAAPTVPPGNETNTGAANDAARSAAPAVQGAAGSATPTTAAEQQKAREELKKSVQALNDFIAPHGTSLNFSIDEDTGSVVVKVTDTETDKVIKQIPSKEALELAKALDKLRGLLVKQEA